MRSAIGLYAILFAVWSSMMFGLYLLFGLVLPAQLPLDEMAFPGLAGSLKVGIGAVLALCWLLLWRELTTKLFRMTVKGRPKGTEER